MSKNKSHKNLLLKSETLRTLSSDALDKIAGGVVATGPTIPTTITKLWCPTKILCPTK